MRIPNPSSQHPQPEVVEPQGVHFRRYGVLGPPPATVPQLARASELQRTTTQARLPSARPWSEGLAWKAMASMALTLTESGTRLAIRQE